MNKFYQYLVEIDAWNGAAVETLKFCGKPQFGEGWEPYLADPGLLKVTMFSNNKTFGTSTYSYGEIVFNNYANESIGQFSGPLDYLRNYSFDGRAVRVLQGDYDQPYNNFTLVYTAAVDHISFDWNKITVSIRSRQVELNDNLDTGVFAGDNVLPAGVEGNATDLKDKPKPILFGRVFNAQPALCNTSKLIYAVSPKTGLAALYMGAELRVYDNGVPLSFGGVYSDQADMEANAPDPGYFKVWEIGGYFRLGASPAGQITFDGCSYGRSVTAKASNLIQDVLTIADKGIAIDQSSFDAIAVSCPAENGVYYTADTPIASILDTLCAGAGIFWYFNAQGELALGQFVDPSTLPVGVTLTTDSIIENFKRMAISDTPSGVPIKSLSLNYAKNYTLQTTAAGSVATQRQAWIKEQWRTVKIVQASDHVLSGDLVIDTALTDPNGTEAQRRFDLYSVDRDLVSMDLDLDVFGGINNIRPGLGFSLTLNDRFGFTDKRMTLVNFTVNHVTEKVTVNLWG